MVMVDGGYGVSSGPSVNVFGSGVLCGWLVDRVLVVCFCCFCSLLVCGEERMTENLK